MEWDLEIGHLDPVNCHDPPKQITSNVAHKRYSISQMLPESSPQEAATRLLIQWKSGNKEALDLLIPIVYSELRRLADHYLRNEHAAATLQPTALVHEAYLRLIGQSLPDWESRSHFFGV